MFHCCRPLAPCQLLELVQRLQRLARAQSIGVDAGQRVVHRAGWGWGFVGRGGKQVDLGLRGAGLLLQRVQRVAGLVQDSGGHAGQPRHLDAVAAAGRAGLQLMQNTMSRPDSAALTCTFTAAWCVAGNSVSSK